MQFLLRVDTQDFSPPCTEKFTLRFIFFELCTISRDTVVYSRWPQSEQWFTGEQLKELRGYSPSASAEKH
jgi:hypothetical protein